MIFPMKMCVHTEAAEPMGQRSWSSPQISLRCLQHLRIVKNTLACKCEYSMPKDPTFHGQLCMLFLLHALLLSSSNFTAISQSIWRVIPTFLSILYLGLERHVLVLHRMPYEVRGAPAVSLQECFSLSSAAAEKVTNTSLVDRSTSRLTWGFSLHVETQKEEWRDQCLQLLPRVLVSQSPPLT